MTLSSTLSKVQPFIAVVVGLVLGLAVTMVAGEDPLNVLGILAKSAFGSAYDFGMTLFYATPLILTGLAVALPFYAGLFNIGAEGQLTMGALAAATVGIMFPDIPWPAAPMLAILAAFAGGALWGYIPGWLRANRGSHEVINTIMLNFVAAGIASWVTLYLLKNPESQNPETKAVGVAYMLKHFDFFGDAPVSTALVLAIFAAVLVWFFLFKTVRGFELRAVGQSERAAETAGIRSGPVRVLSMVLGGGLAGLVGVGEVLGNASRFKVGFSPEFGFIGIAVALLARNKPLGILLSALLFGALHKGASDLDLETENVTRDLSLILQALIIISVTAEGLWDWMHRKPVKPRLGGDV